MYDLWREHNSYNRHVCYIVRIRFVISVTSFPVGLEPCREMDVSLMFLRIADNSPGLLSGYIILARYGKGRPDLRCSGFAFLSSSPVLS